MPIKVFFDSTIIKLANLSAFNYTKNKIDGAFSFQIKTTEFFIPLSANINIEEERTRLEKELNYNLGFLESVMKKTK
jgi:valyl-tRNA synthetase